MEGKKRYIAIILFLLICLTVFTFATTGDEELEKGNGNGNNVQEVTGNGSNESEGKDNTDSKKEESDANESNGSTNNSNSSTDEDEDLDGTGNVDNSAYDKALEAVEELEELLTDEQAKIARDLVDEITNSDQYKELIERIEDAEDAIDATELVEKLEQMVKDAAEKADITDAKDYRDDEVIDAVNEIDGENLAEVKEDLLDRIEELSKILDDETDPTVEGIEDGKHTKEDVSLTITDENEVTTTVTKDGNAYNYVDTFTEEGTYEVTVVDAAFNETTLTFTIDKTAPKFEGLPSREAHIDKYAVDVTDENETTITLQKDHGKFEEIQEGYEITEEGTYQLVAVDKAGNKYTTWVIIDKTNPTITGVTNGSIVNKCENVYVFDRYLKTVVVDGKTYTRKDFTHDVKNENFNFSPEKICAEGTHTVTATDMSGKTRTETFTIDRTKAVRLSADFYVDGKNSIQEIIDGETYNVYYAKEGRVVRANIAMNEELKGMPTFTFYVGGKSYSATETSTSYDATNKKWYYHATVVITDKMADGELTFVASDIYDKAGNKTDDVAGPSNSRRIFVDQTEAKIMSSDFYVHGLTAKDKVFYTKKGKKITVNITTNEILGSNPTFVLHNNGKDYNVDKVVYRGLNDKGYYLYQADYQLTEDSEMTDGEVTFTVSNIIDRADNTTKPVTAPTNSRRVVIDTTAPTAKSNWWKKTVEADKNATFTDFPVFTPSEEATVEYVRGEVKMGVPGVYRIRYRITDLAGNTKDYEVQVTIEDTTPPTTRSNWWKQTLEADKNATFTDFPVFTPSDNAEGEIDIKLTSGEVKMGVPGVYRLNYKFTDESGNSKNYAVQVTIVDTTPATITLPGTVGLNKNEYIVEAGTKVTLNDVLATVTDNVDADSKLEPYKANLLIGTKEENKYNYDFSNGFDTNYHGRYNIYYKYKDAAGNVSEKTMLLVMKDTVAPKLSTTINGKMVYVRGTDVTRLKYTITKDGKTVHTVDSDTCNCGNYFSITWLAKTYGDGDYTIEVVDAGGNKASTTVFVDTTAPVATPSYTEKNIEVNSVKEFTDFPKFEVTDNSNKEVKQELISGEVDPTNVGTYKLVYRFTDERGNYSEETITINVVDTTAPEVTPSYTEKTVEEDSAEEFTDFPKFEVTDNSNKEVKEELISGKVNIHKVGTYKLVYKFTDESGNSTEKTIIIKVVDTKAPTITGIEDGAYYNTKDTHAIPVASDKNGAVMFIKTELGDVTLASFLKNEKEIKTVGTYKVWAVDTYGNKSEEITIHIDPYAPKVLVLDRIENVSGAYLPIKPVILEHNLDTIEVTLDGKKIDFKEGDQLTKDGKYVMTVTDKAGNSTTVEFTMDSVAPTMLISPTTLGVVDSLDLNDADNITGLILSEDAEFQLMKVEKNINVLGKEIPIYKYTKLPEDGIIDEEGQYIIIAYDKAYNVTAYKFIVDRSAPTVNVEEGKYYSSVTINVEDANMATGSLEDLKELIPGLGDIISSVSKLTPSITIKEENDWLSTTIENGYVVDEDGTYTLVAKDVIGVNPLFSKEEQAAHTTTVTFHIDTKKPTANVVEGGVYKKVTVAVVDAHLDEESITINGKKYDGKEITEEGNYVLEAKDLAGNTLTVNFEVDKTPITISGAKEFNNSSVEVEVNSKDENPTIELNGVEVGKKFTASTEGINEVVVVDKWGNSETVTFTIDTIKPVINNPVKLINKDTTVGAVKGTSIPVVATVTDANPTETEVLPIVSHSKLGDLGQLSSISTTKAEVGIYTLTYNTVDKAGNAAEQVVLTVEVFVDDYVLSFNNIKTEYNYGEAIPSLTFADLKLVSDEETIALADGDITFDKKTSDMVKVGKYTVEAKLTKVIDGKEVVRTATVTFEIKPIQAKITFVKTDGYGEINGDTGTFQYEFDGNSNPFTATVEGILDADKDDIVVTVTYNKAELKPGIGFKATATINNDNYYLVGDTFDFDIMKANAIVTLPTTIDGKVTVTNSNKIDISEYATVIVSEELLAEGSQDINSRECLREWNGICLKYGDEIIKTFNIDLKYQTLQVVSNDYMIVGDENEGLTESQLFKAAEAGLNLMGVNVISTLKEQVKENIPTTGIRKAYITDLDYTTEIK